MPLTATRDGHMQLAEVGSVRGSYRQPVAAAVL